MGKQKTVDNTKSNEVVNVVMHYRYQCHGCTNDVYQSEKIEVGKSVTCPKCGKTQMTVAENFITL